MTNLVDAVILYNVCIRIKTMNLFFLFEKYLKYIQKYLYLNTFTNECIWPKEKYLYLKYIYKWMDLTKRKVFVFKYISMYLTPYL